MTKELVSNIITDYKITLRQIKKSIEETSGGAKSTTLEEEKKFVDYQLKIIKKGYQDDTIYFDDYVEEDVNIEIISKTYAYYEFKKFLHKILNAAKGNLKNIGFCLNNLNEYILLDFIRDNVSIYHLSIFIKQLKYDNNFFKSEHFYHAINTAKNLCFITIDIESDIGKSKNSYIQSINNNISKIINKERCFIINFTHKKNSVYFVKKAGSDTIDIFDENTEAINGITDFECELAKKESFGIKLIYRGLLASNIVGELESEVPGDLFLATIDHNKTFQDLRLIDYAIKYNDILAIRFLLLVGNCNLELVNQDNLRSLEIAAECTTTDINTFMALLDIHYPIPQKPILLPQLKAKLLMPSTQSQSFSTPLLIAAENGNHEVMQFLILCGSDIYHYYGSNTSRKYAIDLAWKNHHYDCVLTLLEANSLFPEEFDLNIIPSESKFKQSLSNLVTERNNFHKLISEDNLQALMDFIESNKVSRLCLNTQNESALSVALTKEKYNVYAFLKSKGFKLSINESTFSELLKDKKQEAFKNAMIPYFNKLNSSCVLYLLSKSRILQNDDRFFDEIKSLYEKLATIPEILIILRVIECYTGKVDIIFDFDKDSIVEMDFTGSIGIAGSYDDEGRIYIGAKVDIKELLGTLAHELTHFAMHICYSNKCNPYEANDLAKETQFTRIRNTIKQTSNLDDIIEKVFTAPSYKNKPEVWNLELIVRVPHMLAKYGKEEGYQLLSSQAMPLLKFYKEQVMPACEHFISTANISSKLESNKFNDDVKKSKSTFWKFLPVVSVVMVSGTIVLAANKLSQ